MRQTNTTLWIQTHTMFSPDFHKTRRALRNKDHYRLLMSQSEPFYDHLCLLDARGVNKIKLNINCENNKGQTYPQFLNLSPLYSLQMKKLQDSNHWIKIKTVKRYSYNAAAKDEFNCCNNVCLDLGTTNEHPHIITRQMMRLNILHLGNIYHFPPCILPTLNETI